MPSAFFGFAVAMIVLFASLSPFPLAIAIAVGVVAGLLMEVNNKLDRLLKEQGTKE